MNIGDEVEIGGVRLQLAPEQIDAVHGCEGCWFRDDLKPNKCSHPEFDGTLRRTGCYNNGTVFVRTQHEFKVEPKTPFTNDALNLEILAEEAAEVSQIKSKIIRFGLDDTYPERGKSNRHALEEEVGHFLAMVDILVIRGVITTDGIEKGREQKITKLPKWYKPAE